jgi:DNA-binding response OmpR family regulator
LKILIAEDDEDIAFFYKVALETREHQPTITYNGKDCLTVYQKEFENHVRFFTPSTPSTISNKQRVVFDAVILDYKIPGINGIEVAKEINKINSNQRIIISSASPREVLFHSVTELVENKTIEFIQKPFSLDALFDGLEYRRFNLGSYEPNEDEAVTRVRNHVSAKDMIPFQRPVR